jgi:outer membrane receptor protein involved in Fe transport
VTAEASILAKLDPIAATESRSTPRTQLQARTTFSPAPRATLSASIFHVGAIEQLNVAAYTRADVSAEWRFTRGLSATAIGQNLFDAAHREFGGTSSFLLVTEVPRSASLRLRWMF